MISVFIRVFNEEANLAICLESLAWCDDVVVLDDNSTDKSVEIARRYGARIINAHFDHEQDQLNWAIANILFRNDWIYQCDADEIVTPELAKEMLTAVFGSGSLHSAYCVRYKNYFCGKWIKRCGIYPVWLTRLYKKDAIRWEREINTRPHVSGSVGFLENHFHHFSFNKGLEQWIGKHNRYSSAEAREAVKSVSTPLHWEKIFSGLIGRQTRRQTVKELAIRIPLRPAVRFVYMYFFRLGFLDGAAGFHYCVLLSIYEYFIHLKALEIERPPFGR